MQKFTKEFKIECIKKYKDSIPIKIPDGWKKDNFYHEVRIWEQMFEKFGDKVFDKNKPKFTYKEIIKFYKRIENGESLRSVAISIVERKAQ